VLRHLALVPGRRTRLIGLGEGTMYAYLLHATQALSELDLEPAERRRPLLGSAASL
jgi:hypothetical protein